MKRAILLSVCLLGMAMTYAQNSFYVSLGIGAGINTARTYDLYQDGDKVHPVGLGKSFGPAIRAGVFLNDFIAVELGVVYRMGINTKVNVATSTSSGWDKFKGNMLQLVPAVVIQPDFDLGSVSPYARVGVLIGVLPSITCNFDVTRAGTERVGTLRYTGGVAVGGSAALGCDIDITDMLSLYVELSYDAMAYAPTKGKLVKYTENGADKLGDLSTQDKETKFVKDISGFVADPNSPDQQLKNSYPFNNFALNFGVKISL